MEQDGDTSPRLKISRCYWKWNTNTPIDIHGDSVSRYNYGYFDSITTTEPLDAINNTFAVKIRDISLGSICVGISTAKIQRDIGIGMQSNSLSVGLHINPSYEWYDVI